MSCSATSVGACDNGPGEGFLSGLVGAVTPSLLSADGPPVAWSVALVSFLVAAHFVNKEWHLWRDVRLSLEALFDRVPDISTDVDLPPLQLPDDAAGTPQRSEARASPASPPPLVDAADPGVLHCYNPATLEHLGTVPNLAAEQVSALALRSKVAQEAWRTTTFAQRRRVLRTLQRYVVAHVDELCQLCARDSGKTPVDALLGEILTTCEKARTLLHRGEAWLEPSRREVNPMMLHKRATVEYVPLGVLGIIAPWNYPFHNLLNHVLSGIFSGNGVVTKCSEHTSWSSVHFHRICRAALEANGHDPELVQLCTGTAAAGQALVACPHVDKVFFTGSPGVGRSVMAGAAPHLKPVVLELGGKDAMVFCEDVRLQDVLPWALRGCFQNCGQNCCGVERLFVYESRVEEFLAAIAPKVRDLRQGCPLSDNFVDCGAMVMDAQCALVQELVDDAVAKGAKLHCGGRRNNDNGGQFYAPTLLSHVTRDMRIWREEVFGPVMCVVTVPGDDDDACVAMVNDCRFGLGSSVYAASGARARALGARFRTGMFTANDFGVNYLIQSLPFGGVGESGFGRFAGPEGLRSCCLERAIVVDRIPGVRTSIPGPIGYPMDTRQGMGFGKGLIRLFYGHGVRDKVRGIVDLIRNS